MSEPNPRDEKDRKRPRHEVLAIVHVASLVLAFFALFVSGSGEGLGRLAVIVPSAIAVLAGLRLMTLPHGLPAHIALAISIGAAVLFALLSFVQARAGREPGWTRHADAAYVAALARSEKTAIAVPFSTIITSPASPHPNPLPKGEGTTTSPC